MNSQSRLLGALDMICRAKLRRLRSRLGETTNCQGFDRPGPISQDKSGLRSLIRLSISVSKAEFPVSADSASAFSPNQSQNAACVLRGRVFVDFIPGIIQVFDTAVLA